MRQCTTKKQISKYLTSLFIRHKKTHLKRERNAHDSRFFATTRFRGKDYATTSVLVRVFYFFLFVVEYEYCIQTRLTFVNEVPALFFSTVFHIIIIIIIEWFEYQ